MSEAAVLLPPAAAPVAAAALRVEFITEVSQLPALAQQWEALNRRQSDHPANFFQSFAWTYHVARVRSRRPRNQFQQLVATVWRGADLIGVWPLSLQRAMGMWLVRQLDDPFGQFAGVVSGERHDIAPAVAAILEALSARAAGLQIAAVVAGSALHEALLRCGAKAMAAQQAVFIDLRRFASIREFRLSVNSKTRKNLRNLRNRLERAHRLEQVVAEAPAQLDALVRETFEARVQWLRRNGRTSPAFRDEDFRTLVAELTRNEDINLRGFALTTPEGWIAAQWGFVYAGRYYAYVSAMDPSFEQFSPGRMHLEIVIESCLQCGIEVVELMPPASDYKLTWSAATKKLETIIIPFNLVGRFTLGATGWLVPKVRLLSRAVPGSLRKPLMRRLNKL